MARRSIVTKEESSGDTVISVTISQFNPGHLRECCSLDEVASSFWKPEAEIKLQSAVCPRIDVWYQQPLLSDVVPQGLEGHYLPPFDKE